MTTTSPSSQPTRSDPVAAAPSRQPGVGWLSLLVAAGCATIASFVIAMIVAGSIEAFFLAMATAIVLGLLVV